MHIRKLVLAALAAAMVLATVVASASANSLSVNEQRYRMVYRPMEFVPSFGETVRCNVTLEGTFHTNTIAKTRGLLIGYITSAVVRECTGGTARANTETLPWHVQYESFAGTLPSITSITDDLINSSFEVESRSFGISGLCRYTPASERGINTREPRGVVTETRPGAETISSPFPCPNGRLEGRGALTTPTGGSIVVNLI